MKVFSIQITAMMPYPVDYDYRVEASSMPTAVARALRNFRKDSKGYRIGKMPITIKVFEI